MNILKKVREQFQALNIDGLLITNAQNRRYLTGFTGTAGVVLISKKEAKFLTDFRYKGQAVEQVLRIYDINIHGGSHSLIDNVIEQVKAMKINKLGFEAEDINFEFYSQLNKKLNIDLVPTKKAIEQFRMVKTEEEIYKIKKAAEIGDAAFEYIRGFIRPGITELEVAHELEYFMRKRGATSNSSAIIVASGHRSSLPHGVASDKVIENGDMVTLDYGALYQGYRSDMTRTLAVGEPKPELKKIYSIVHEALQRCLDTIKAGMLAKEVDAIVRDFITEKGYGEYFGHGSGHGIGLNIHEEPFFSRESEQELKTGMVVTIEPGIYIPNIGGVRIEDDVLIKEDCCEILTQSSRDLIVL